MNPIDRTTAKGDGLVRDRFWTRLVGGGGAPA